MFSQGECTRGIRIAIEIPEGIPRCPPMRSDNHLMVQMDSAFHGTLCRIPHHGLGLWLQVQIFYDHVNSATQMAIDYAAGVRLRKLRPEKAWETIEDLAQHEEEEWNDPIFFEKESPDYIDATLEQELESMEYGVESLMKNEVLLEYEL
ncbi:hypothetical protein Tco_0428807 [Tanacetum coccineum]